MLFIANVRSEVVVTVLDSNKGGKDVVIGECRFRSHALPTGPPQWVALLPRKNIYHSATPLLNQEPRGEIFIGFLVVRHNSALECMTDCLLERGHRERRRPERGREEIGTKAFCWYDNCLLIYGD